jgi:hypothetical protein
MGPLALLGPFLDYLRPTKSPYLIIQFVAVFVICYKITRQPVAAALDSPQFFLPIFLLVLALIPLSFMRRDQIVQNEPPPEGAAQIANPKFENDLDSVFKFSRALCLASAVVMLFVYFQNPPSDNWYATVAYAMIILQMATFLLYTAIRHFKGEDLSNVNLFQIAFITAVFFAGATYLATQIKQSEPELRYMYYCKTKTVEYTGMSKPRTSDCSEAETSTAKVSNVTLRYSLDYRQLSFVLFAICWLIYELFWLKTLFAMRAVPNNAAATKIPGTK